MRRLTQTVHHALGTFVAGSELADDHPLVVAGPHLFEPVADDPKPATKATKAAKAKADD